MGKHTTKTVSFRFQRDDLEALAEWAKADGLSTGDFVRKVVKQHLGGAGQDNQMLETLRELDESVTALHDDLRALRAEAITRLQERLAWLSEALPLVTALLLADAGKGAGVEEGLAIVRSLLSLEGTEGE